MLRPKTVLRIAALALTVVSLIMTLVAVWQYGNQTDAPRLDITEEGATIQFTSSAQQVLLDSSCVDTRWQVEGIRTVHVNGKPVIGEGQTTVCGESPRLTVTLLDGSAREFELPREVALTTPLRALAVASVLSLLVAFIGWRAPGIMRPMLSTFRNWLAAETRSNRLALYIISALGFALRLIHLNGPVKQDEVVTFLSYASKSTWDAISLYYSTNNHVLNSLLMNFSHTLLGNQPWVLRMPVFIAGVLLVPATYIAGRALYNSRAGLLAAAFVAASSVLTVFSTYGRGYMLQALFGVVMLAAAVCVFRRRDPFGWVLYAACIALGFYTSASMVYPFAAISGWVGLNLLRAARQARSLRPMTGWFFATIGGLGVAALLHLPVFIVSGLDAFLANEYVIPQSVAEFAEKLPGDLLSAWHGWTTDLPLALSVVLAAGFFVAMVRNGRMSTFAVSVGLVAVLVMPPIMFLLRVPIYERVLIPILPLFFIVACGGIVHLLRLAERWAAPVTTALAVLLVLIVVSTNSVHRAAHWDMGAFPEGYDLMRVVTPLLEPQDVVVVHRRGDVMRYYAQLYDIGLEYVTLPNDPETARRVFIAAPYPSQPPDKVLADFGFDPASFSAPELLQHIDNYALYLVTRPSLAVQSS